MGGVSLRKKNNRNLEWISNEYQTADQTKDCVRRLCCRVRVGVGGWTEALTLCGKSALSSVTLWHQYAAVFSLISSMLRKEPWPGPNMGPDVVPRTIRGETFVTRSCVERERTAHRQLVSRWRMATMPLM